MTPSQSKAVGSVCLFAAFSLVGGYDRLREVSDDLAHAAVFASLPLVLGGLYLFVYRSIKKPRKPR